MSILRARTVRKGTSLRSSGKEEFDPSMSILVVLKALL